MASYYDHITGDQADLIRQSRLFFIASADPALAAGPHEIGPVNLSPRGGVPLHILDSNHVAFLDYVGSGNETARHSQAGGPATIMVCSFEDEDAAIVRLYGRARVTPLAESRLAGLLLEHAASELKSPTRQVVELQVTRTATSCGYGVPVMHFVRERRVVDRGRCYKDGRLASQHRGLERQVQSGPPSSVLAGRVQDQSGTSGAEER
jgi:hypothetical protein